MKLLFVCIGNTCRSPMAESVMNHYIKERNLDWEADSAGLRAWNVGYAPEERCIKILSENGLTTAHIGREIKIDDFYLFDYIFGMDESNMHELNAIAIAAGAKCTTKIELLGSYLGREEDKIIHDPYFSTGLQSFRCAYAQISESCQNFIKKHALQ
ncbi:low molecular weight phosphotyrosine protein phosphatase 1-like [Teleopsis dalmanni]|uniref:low molecular weight phosphotyrosine protein phosphatase 1-like n=1 Tax=Teleopsis dalmanni TaxID=139649 RepID=UPI0018CE6F9F|nr:low molecular weight phosphotyrosine protein phosphatase 1-like [Teleopsis dalmanni]